MVSKTTKKAEKIVSKTPAQLRHFKQRSGKPIAKVLRNAFPNASHHRETQRKSLKKKARQLKSRKSEPFFSKQKKG